LSSFLIFISIFGGGYLYLNNAEARLQDRDYIDIINDPGNAQFVPPESENQTVINTLVMGVDEARSDTMMVVRYNKETHRISMISIPRDTRVNIPGYGYTKINAAVGKKEGSALAMKTVSNFLNIPIHHYIKVDFKAVIKIVDIIGGVKVNVPINMNYDDPAQDLHIHINKGTQVLNGKNALHFLRFRSGYADQDLGRIKAQQEFAKAFVKKLTSPSNILKAGSLINTIIENTKTNLKQEDIALYVKNISEINMDQIKMYTVPGDGEGKKINGVAYFIHDDAKLREIMDQMNAEVGADNQQSVQQSGDTPSPSEEEAARANIKIEILNSTSKSGLSATLKKELEQKGFKIHKIGDTKGLTYAYSRVIDRHGDSTKLELVSKEAGIQITDSDINPDYDYDITIILGDDRK
jgi:LCP family protein required for cell wall assembly